MWKLRKEGRKAIERFGEITDNLLKFYDEMNKESLEELSFWLQIFAYAYVENEINELLGKYKEDIPLTKLKTIVSPFTETSGVMVGEEDAEDLGIRVFEFSSYSELKEKRKERVKDYVKYYSEEFYVGSMERAVEADLEFLRIYRKIKEREIQDELWELYGHKGVSIFIVRNKVVSKIVEKLESSGTKTR